MRILPARFVGLSSIGLVRVRGRQEMPAENIVAVVAYVDPTTGGILLQLLVGGSAAYLIVLRLFRRRITSMFRRRPKPEVGE
jgi:hypothetical protein